jgi:probable HAF family extracellular repeat protein
MEDIGQSVRGIVSRGFGINNTGLVVGDSAFIASHTADSPIRHASLFSNGSVTDLGTSKRQTFSRANGITGFNQVVGFSGPALDSPKSRAFFWSKSTGMIDLGTLGGGYPRHLPSMIRVPLPVTRNFVRALSTAKLCTRSFPHHPWEQER